MKALEDESGEEIGDSPPPVRRLNNLKGKPMKQDSSSSSEEDKPPRRKRKPTKQEWVEDEDGEEIVEGKKKSIYDKSCKHFQLTIFNHFEEVSKYIRKREKTLIYYVDCWERCPTTGNEHWHIYCHFNCSVRLSQKKCFNAHLEPCRGSPKENRDYIKKIGKHEDDFYRDPNNHLDLSEIGSLPTSTGNLTGDELMVMSNREIVMHDPRCHKAYLEAKKKLSSPGKIPWNNTKKKIKVYYICGPSNSHKSDTAEHIGFMSGLDPEGFNRITHVNGFWDPTDTDSKIVIYDEFRDSHMKPSEFLKFIDYRAAKLNEKGSSFVNNWELIIFTSVQSFDRLWKGMSDKEESKKQWERRVEVINFYSFEKHPMECDDYYDERCAVLKEYLDGRLLKEDDYNDYGKYYDNKYGKYMRDM